MAPEPSARLGAASASLVPCPPSPSAGPSGRAGTAATEPRRFRVISRESKLLSDNSLSSEHRSFLVRPRVREKPTSGLGPFGCSLENMGTWVWEAWRWARYPEWRPQGRAGCPSSRACSSPGGTSAGPWRYSCAGPRATPGRAWGCQGTAALEGVGRGRVVAGGGGTVGACP